MFFFQEGFTYRNCLMDVLAIFGFVVWFWLLVIIYGDLFRRHDIAGWHGAPVGRPDRQPRSHPARPCQGHPLCRGFTRRQPRRYRR